MKDQYGRIIEYMRISITDRCNLQCLYCVPKEGMQCMEKEELLTKDEIIEVVRAASKLGIKKIKLTGGEPLLYKELITLIKDIKAVEGIKEVTITTNGVLLYEKIYALKEAGIDGINISLDTLNQKKFHKITRQNSLDKVIKAFHKSLELGIRTKINCLALGGFNEKELVRIASLARDYKTDVRFIELMPIGYGKYFERVTYSMVRERLEKAFGKSIASSDAHGNGPARYFEFSGFQGAIGFISAISNEFCESCNRIRLTADGKLKLCLHYNHGIDLKELIRSGISTAELTKVMGDAIYYKPNQHSFNKCSKEDMESRNMVQIGG